MQQRMMWMIGLLVVGGATAAWLLTLGAGEQSVASTPSSQGSGSEFAAERSQDPAQAVAGFDKNRAFEYLKQICDLGPRVSGTPGFHRMVDLLEAHFTQLGLQVERQKFMAKQRSRPRPIEMTNLIARYKPEAQRRVIICAHYDPRPIADQEPNERDWYKPFIGANDGASGPAFMMEFAKLLPQLKLEVGVDFVLFDGEEYIFWNVNHPSGPDEYFFGSKHFAQVYEAARKAGSTQVYFEAVLLDMIVGKNPIFRYEGYSWLQAGPLAQKLWKIAAEVKAPAFQPQFGHSVLDDHLALLQAGIPTVNIVPASSQHRMDGFLDYPHWHRLSDIPANCDPDGFDQVARVLAVWLQRAR
ncbi:MAG TPA: M28 family peptidase [Gemmatales bacterium]|nr:M28 family peptidase [Gemmatales bacterium]